MKGRRSLLPVVHAIVFAAGRGTRLRPLTDETPKPLLEVGGEPILARCLHAVADAGVDGITVVVGYRGHEIVDRFGDSFRGVPIRYATQEEREGLAHAVLAAAERVDLEAVGSVVTVNGDNVFDCDLAPLVERHRDPDADGTVLLDRASRNEAETTALCDLEDDGTIRAVASTVADHRGGYVAGGVQTHDGAALLEACRRVDRGESGEYELADALQAMVDRGRRYVGVELEGWHLNVNTRADLERARRRFADPGDAP